MLWGNKVRPNLHTGRRASNPQPGVRRCTLPAKATTSAIAAFGSYTGSIPGKLAENELKLLRGPVTPCEAHALIRPTAPTNIPNPLKILIHHTSGCGDGEKTR